MRWLADTDREKAPGRPLRGVTRLLWPPLRAGQQRPREKQRPRCAMSMTRAGSALLQDKETPLHRAVELNKPDMVTALLKAGAKTDLTNTVRPRKPVRALAEGTGRSRLEGAAARAAACAGGAAGGGSGARIDRGEGDRLAGARRCGRLGQGDARAGGG